MALHRGQHDLLLHDGVLLVKEVWGTGGTGCRAWPPCCASFLRVRRAPGPFWHKGTPLFFQATAARPAVARSLPGVAGWRARRGGPDTPRRPGCLLSTAMVKKYRRLAVL